MKKPTMASLLKRIEQLEAEIEALKAAPRETHNHFHTHYPPAPQGPLWSWADSAHPWERPLWCGSGTVLQDARQTIGISGANLNVTGVAVDYTSGRGTILNPKEDDK